MVNPGDEYPKSGILVAFIFIIMGIVILFLSGIINADNTYILQKSIANNGFEITVSVLFIFIGVYIIVLYINNVFTKPKEEIVYLEKIENNICFFIDLKGKRLYSYNKNYIEDNFYKVKRTKNKIHEVLELVQNDYEIPTAKESYLLNFYSPVGNFENLFLLPILYVILLPGLLSFLLSFSLYSLIFMGVPLFAIIYDGIYKYKKYKNENFDETKFLNAYETLGKIIGIIISLIAVIYLFKVLIGFKNTESRLTFLPFFIIVLLIFIGYILSLFKEYDIQKIINKAMVIVFLIFWFGLITFATAMSIKEKEYSMLVIIIPFYLVGFYAIYDKLIKK